MKKQDYQLKFKGLMSMNDSELRSFNRECKGLEANLIEIFPPYVTGFLINRYNSAGKEYVKLIEELNSKINNRTLSKQRLGEILKKVAPSINDSNALLYRDKPLNAGIWNIDDKNLKEPKLPPTEGNNHRAYVAATF